MTQVRIYIFRADDGLSPEQRLYWAVQRYCREMEFAAGEDGQSELCAVKSLRIERTAAGKPYFPDCPGLHFSISHSGEYWACAVSDINIGLDLQKQVLRNGETEQEAEKRWGRMAKRFYHPAEAAFAENDCFNRFFAVWAAREAYVKNTGQGIDRDFSAHCVVPLEWAQNMNSEAAPTKGALEKSSGIEKSWSAMEKYFRVTVYNEEYFLCVCGDNEFEWKNMECEKDCYR